MNPSPAHPPAQAHAQLDARRRSNRAYWITCALGCGWLTGVRYVLLTQEVRAMGIVCTIGLAWFISMATLLCLSVRTTCVLWPQLLALKWSDARRARALAPDAIKRRLDCSKI